MSASSAAVAPASYVDAPFVRALETVVASRESIEGVGALRGYPMTTLTLRTADGSTHEVRIVGGSNRHGGETWLADTPVPPVGTVVPANTRSWSHFYTRETPPATWPAAKIPVPFTFQLADPKDLAGAAFPEFDVAERAWGHVACTAFRASLAARASVVGADDGVNAVIWHDDAWPSELATEKLGQVVISTNASGDLEDVDIHMNGADYTWSLDGAAGTVDARGVYEHELGHALGLGHSSDTTATMYAADPAGEAWRSLEQDDRDGVCALYPGAGAAGCESGPACPSGYVCVAGACERLGETAEVCSPCVREVGACAGAGEGARCIDIGSGNDAGRVCSRKCATNADCGGGFDCQPTTSSGDLQCVPNDACASGPDPCKIDADCNGTGVCRSGACVGLEPASSGDAGTDASAAGGNGAAGGPSGSDGGCSFSPGRAESGMWTIVPFAFFLVRRKRKRALAAAAALAALACSSCDKHTDLSPQSPSTPLGPVASDTDDAGQTSCQNVVARIDSLGRHLAKPPLAVYTFDVRLHNPSNEPRWLVLPSTFTYDGKDDPAPGKGTMNDLKAEVRNERGRLVWVTALGTGGFRALLLPGHANVTLRNLSVDAWWTLPHKTAKLEVILAKSIRIDDQPLEKFVQGDLRTDADADIAMDLEARDVRKVDKSVAGDDARNVTFEEDCRGVGQAILKLEEP